ncbi:MAG: hypothetical protein QOJ70_3111 [Acidobacteriota bacterium]|jgi:hypothetical protein|nr:hypothetical protein [Acidobacteriota bacterium]MDT7809298.1 hypothetical protein [Acidobacteriota bacterium]
MPFGKNDGTDFDEVYQSAIKAACQEVGATCIRADALSFSGSVLRNIHNSITKADFVIADLTGRNPNVLYELGYALALDKRVLLLARDATDIPFDILEQRVILYDEDIRRLKDNLVASLNALISSPRKDDDVGATRGELIRPGNGGLSEVSDRPELVFISYSHLDNVWLERLEFMYKPLVWHDKILVWDDKQIPTGGDWNQEIDRALTNAKVAVLLVSQGFLASDFIREKELPRIIAAAKTKQLVIVWALLEVCFYETTELVNIQAAHDIKHPLDSLNRQKRNVVLRDICVRISTALGL